MKLYRIIFLLLVLPLIFIGCEEEEQDTIERAQHCLDYATSATANGCLAILGNLQTPESYAIRCSARFIGAGLTASQMAQAYINNEATGTSKDPLLGLMGIVSFTSTATANAAYTECILSTVPSFAVFAGMAKISTKIKDLGGIVSTTTPTQAEMETALASLSSASDADKEEVGAAVVVISQKFCKDHPDNDICKDVNAAVGSGATNLAIANQFIDRLNNTN
jgi:hypothetical protein